MEAAKPTGAGQPDGQATSNRKLLSSGGLKLTAVVLAFAVITAIHMGAALTDCNSTIMGGPGDATSGGVWSAWQYGKLGGPWVAQTDWVSAPFEGEPFRHSHSITSTVPSYLLWSFSQVTRPVCAWNLVVFSGFLVSALLTYGFARWLTRSTWAGLFAGYAYAFSPFHVYKAQGHHSYLYSGILVALLWAGLALWDRPGWKRAFALGGLLALLAYTEGYFILIGSATFAGFVLGALVYTVVTRDRPSTPKAPIKHLFVAMGFAALLLVPIAYTYLTQSQAISESLPRSQEELRTYSSRAHEFVLPPRTHFYFSKFFASFQEANLHGSNFSEQTLYIGWSVILLAGGLIAWRLVGRRVVRENQALSLPTGFVLASLASVVAVTLWFSAPPKFEVAGIGVIGPSLIVFAVVPLWRVYARFFVATHAALVPLAAVGLALFLRSRRVWRKVAAGGLMVFLVFEFLTFPPRSEWSYSQVPDEYSWLKIQDDIRLVIEYPLATPPQPEALSYMTFQPVHEKRLANSHIGFKRSQQVLWGLYGLEDPQTLPGLRALGVDLVMINTDFYPSAVPIDSPPPGLSLAEEIPGNVYGFRVDPGPEAEVLLAVQEGFFDPEPRGWLSFRWMGPVGVIRVKSISRGHPRASVTFTAESSAVPRTLRVSQNGVELWTGEIDGLTKVSFVAATSQPISLRVDPGVSELPDGRFVTIGISLLNASALQ